MSLLIAVPVYRVSCKINIKKGRSWSVVDELLLWAVAQSPKTIDQLVDESRLRTQIITSSVAQLMRFRLIEVAPVGGDVFLRASKFGLGLISSGNPLPENSLVTPRRVSCVIERVSGGFFSGVDRLMSDYKLKRLKNADVRWISVDSGEPPMCPEDNFARFEKIAARRGEEIVSIESRTSSFRDDEFMIVSVADGAVLGLPKLSSAALRSAVKKAAEEDEGQASDIVSVPYAGLHSHSDGNSAVRACDFSPEDVIIGGSHHRELFIELLRAARRHMIIHSTFLDASQFKEWLEPIRAACQRGVKFDLLWGDAKGEGDEENKNYSSAIEISKLLTQDALLNSCMQIHMRTTSSHAKVLLLDTDEGWIATVGSCNWLSSPFRSVELTVVLRDNMIVSDVASAMQRMVGLRGLSSRVANDLAILSRKLRRARSEDGTARVKLVAGEEHDQCTRTASRDARSRFFVGSNRIGSTARPGAIMQGELAAGRDNVVATVLYTHASGPLKNRHARELSSDAEVNGVRLLRTPKKLPLHGKLVAWDDDDVVITSLNWASAAADMQFPLNDLGVHVSAPEIAADVMERLEKLYPEIAANCSGRT